MVSGFVPYVADPGGKVGWNGGPSEKCHCPLPPPPSFLSFLYKRCLLKWMEVTTRQYCTFFVIFCLFAALFAVHFSDRVRRAMNPGEKCIGVETVKGTAP